MKLPLPPPHMDLSDQNFVDTQDSAGFFPTLEVARGYEESISTSDYQLSRLRALRSLTSRIASPLNVVVDFGIAGGGTLISLDLHPRKVIGIDVSPAMLELAEETLGQFQFEGRVGSVEQTGSISSGSVDLVLCINTLGYLTELEQKLFFDESQRVLAKGGYLLVMTGNELFDMYALNSGTADFFKKYFDHDVTGLLVEGNSKRFKNADRRNPLSFGDQMSALGFRELEQDFAMWHTGIPAISNSLNTDNFLMARTSIRDYNFDPRAMNAQDRWKCLFRCSIFASLLQKI